MANLHRPMDCGERGGGVGDFENFVFNALLAVLVSFAAFALVSVFLLQLKQKITVYQNNFPLAQVILSMLELALNNKFNQLFSCGC